MNLFPLEISTDVFMKRVPMIYVFTGIPTLSHDVSEHERLEAVSRNVNIFSC